MNTPRSDRAVLVASIFIVGLCSIVYELLISTTSSYFLGDSIKQFSITIGVYMAAMGLGSFLIRFLKGDTLNLFVKVELALGVFGALSVPVLYLWFSTHGYDWFQTVMLSFVVVIGTLTGLEIPLLTRLLQPHYEGEEALSNVLTLDYVGALAATLLFPFILLPFVGVFQSSIIFGIVNVLVAVYTLFHFRENPKRKRFLVVAVSLLAALGLLLGLSAKLLDDWRGELFRDPIVFTETTPYQSLTMTRKGDDTRLYIDRVIQWSSTDEYRYHESLVHPAMLSVKEPKRVLVLGGGEGLAIREILRHPEVDSVTVVDIDPAIFNLARSQRQLLDLNARALYDPRVRSVPQDAFVFLSNATAQYDVIIADLPDPTNDGVARLYSVEFFRLCRRLLRDGGAIATQATGPFHTRKAFWSIGATITEAFDESPHTALLNRAPSVAPEANAPIPYHTYVASFGDWGFWLIPGNRGTNFRAPDFNPRYYSKAQFQVDGVFPKDMGPQEVDPNTLDQPRLLDYYLEDWRRLSGEKVVW
ncbi:MAG: polyamine aminopropyltransferase [Saprospiraceae bacterium]